MDSVEAIQSIERLLGNTTCFKYIEVGAVHGDYVLIHHFTRYQGFTQRIDS